jgi:hypothetical protein
MGNLQTGIMGIGGYLTKKKKILYSVKYAMKADFGLCC